jgi:hypothetical protein
VGGKPAAGRDFLPCPERPIVFGEARIPAPAARDRLLFETVTELALFQNETCRITRERNALTRALEQIAEGDEPKAAGFAREVLDRLAGGELRKAGG